MNDQLLIKPARKLGYAIQLLLVLIFATLAIFSIAQALYYPIGTLFLIFMFTGLMLALPIPLLLYRMYSLSISSYLLSRDGLQVKWGLREIHLPMTEIEWVRLENTLEQPLLLPRLRWPGGVLGIRSQPTLGDVEFMANRSDGLVLIGANQGVYAISPPDQKEFIQSFRKQIELGPLKSMGTYSVYPSFLIAELWKIKSARAMLLIGILLNLILFILVAVGLPSKEIVSLGFAPNGALLPSVPSVQLFLLPILSLSFYLMNTVIAAYFFRREERHPIAYLLWVSSIVTTLLFLLAVFVILGVG